MQPYEEELEDVELEDQDDAPVDDDPEAAWYDDRFRILHWDP